jgi:acyl-CoA reductase-like NAD-dependent aldehyde dehydrogenase
MTSNLISPLTAASRAFAAHRAATSPAERAEHLRAARASLEEARGALYRLDACVRAAELAAGKGEVTQ